LASVFCALPIDQVHSHTADLDRTVCCALAKARCGFQGPRAIDGHQIEAAKAFAAPIGVLDESNRRVFEA
jgi:citrate lyase beta subunit